MGTHNYCTSMPREMPSGLQSIWDDWPHQMSRPTQEDTPASRVCDKCMVKKRKCNRVRPSCSRCTEDNLPCVYSSSKRKPGPAKGSRRVKKPSTEQPATSSAEQYNQQHLSPRDFDDSNFVGHDLVTGRIQEDLIEQPSLAPAYPANESVSCTPGADNNHSYGTLMRMQLSPEQTRQTLDLFFEGVHSRFLFTKDIFLKKYDQGLIYPDLLLTILAITSHIHGLSNLWTAPTLKGWLDQTLSTKFFDADFNSNALLLSKFQQACLLAFYEFHQYPSHKAWLRISELTREAYSRGLHQLDNAEQCQLYSQGSVTAEDLEEWRRCWWCVYCLDSYSNITAFTPFVIDLDSVTTALIPEKLLPGQPEALLYLPTDIEQLCETSKAVSSRTDYFYINMHIVTTTILREAAKTVRLRHQKPSARADTYFNTLDNHLSAVRLALPLRFLDVSRNIMIDETQAEHHARLICMLHLLAAQLNIRIPMSFQKGEQVWLQGWQGTLECCEEVVHVIKQWKSQFCLSVDPAICFIVAAVFKLLHLHFLDVANAGSPEFLSRLHSQKELLRLLLEQFASIWHLPRFLIASCQKFSDIFTRTLTANEIAGILSKMKGELNSGWLRFLSLNSDDLRPPEVPQFDINVLSQGDFGEWETWADVSNMMYMG